MPLSTSQIQAVREGTDIVGLVGRYVKLRKQGQRYLGLCPFHSEKTPSFSVSADKGLYHCFGCHAGGDVFSFLMRYQGLDFNEAVRTLALEAGIALEPESPEAQKRRSELDELAQVNSFAQAYFEHQLWQQSGRAAREYLLKRGLPEKLTRQRKLGYGGSTVELFAYLASKNIDASKAARAGILTDDGQRCLFEGRLTFPILDSSGRLAGFGGRRLQAGSAPKYVNSRETLLFAKRRLVYGWDVAQDAIRRTGRVVLVEGYMDVLACENAQIDEAVAALGTALTDDHAQLCARLAKEAVLAFDGDAAGQAATRNACERLLKGKMRVSVVVLPDGQDPDSLLQSQGAEVLREILAQPVPALEHFMTTLFAGGATSIEARADAARELAPLLAALQSGLERDLYLSRLAEKVGLTTSQLQEHLKGSNRTPRDKLPSAQAEQSAEDRGVALKPLDAFELNALSQILLYPDLRSRLSDLSEFAGDYLRAVLEDLAKSEDAIEIILARHIKDLGVLERLKRIEPIREDLIEAVQSRGRRTFEDVLAKLKSRYMRQTLKKLREEMQEASSRGENVDDVLRRIHDLTRRERQLRRPDSAAKEPVV